MKLLSTMITTEKETTKEITVCVDDGTAMALEQCTEEIRHMYILEEYEDQKLTHTETRRIVSYEQITEGGFDIADPENSPTDMLISREVNQRVTIQPSKVVYPQERKESLQKDRSPACEL